MACTIETVARSRPAERLRIPWHRAGSFVLLLLWPFASAARADDTPCGRAGRPWVALVFAGEGWQQEQRESITADLRAGLRLRGIDVCALGAAGSEPPLALVQLGAASQERVSVTIDVHDAITEKRVLRDVDLRRVTSDGRGLRVAQASEELLRASWAELALTDAPEPATQPPAEVTAAVMPRPSAPDRSHQLGTRFALEHYGAGATLLGGDVAFSWLFAGPLGAEIALGLRRGLREDATHGSIDANAVVGTLALSYALLPTSQRFGLQVKLGTSLSHLRFSGRGDGTVLAQERALLASSMQAALSLSAWLTRTFALFAQVGPGLPLRAATALDTGHAVVGTTGLELHGALGIGVAF